MPGPTDPPSWLSIRLAVDDKSDWTALPASPGVVMFCGEGFERTGRAVQISATGNAREFCRARLDASAQLGPKADLRPITSEVRAMPVGSAFEADWLTLELARRHLPESYHVIADRWRGWFVQIDAAASPPTWRKTDLRDLVEPEATGGEVAGRGEGPGAELQQDSVLDSLVGPMPDKQSAGKLGELLDDAFELCRYPRELAKAPAGSACAYKGMGCPAACDGSETMTAYVRRVELARDFAATARIAEDPMRRVSISAQMHDAAAARRFEVAGRMKKRLERLDEISKPAFRNLGPLRTLGVLGVLPSERTGHARLVAFVGGELLPIADVDAGMSREGLDEVVGVIEQIGRTRAGFVMSRASVERLGLVCTYWFKPRSKQHKRRATFFDLRQGMPEGAALGRAVSLAAMPSGIGPSGAGGEGVSGGEWEIHETDLSGPAGHGAC